MVKTQDFQVDALRSTPASLANTGVDGLPRTFGCLGEPQGAFHYAHRKVIFSVIIFRSLIYFGLIITKT